PARPARAPAPEPLRRAETVRDQVVAAYTQGGALVRDRPRFDPLLTMVFAAFFGFLLGLVVRESR
ncbi:hypothetical protein P7D22_10190, partial [Lichenihabitans sp. Uapishka_5]|uniref:hypothetical protein n=1 Tax=Lichenihabitans sp. Uapishka_5 TaxID=3037302 RepID=UPI0029E7F366